MKAASESGVAGNGGVAAGAQLGSNGMAWQFAGSILLRCRQIVERGRRRYKQYKLRARDDEEGSAAKAPGRASAAHGQRRRDSGLEKNVCCILSENDGRREGDGTCGVSNLRFACRWALAWRNSIADASEHSLNISPWRGGGRPARLWALLRQRTTASSVSSDADVVVAPLFGIRLCGCLEDAFVAWLAACGKG